MSNEFNRKAFWVAYLEAAIWTDQPEDEGDVDWSAQNINFNSAMDMVLDCGVFMNENAADLQEYLQFTDRDESGAGHDFWLTRNGHGAGFWDRDYSDDRDDIGVRLTEACKAFSVQNLYSGDDGEIYVA